MDVFSLAEKEPETTFVFAALGFETTTPVYALLLEEVIERKIENVKLLTALKTMPGVIVYLCENGASIQGYLAPGHVAAVTGSDLFKPLAEMLKKIETIDRHQCENYLTTLRLTICSEEIPLEERIAAGDKYVKLGGNGAVKHKYEELIKQLDEKEK